MKKFGFIDLEKEIGNVIENFGEWIAIRSVDLTKRTREAEQSIPAQYEQSNPDYQHIVANYYYVDKLARSFRYLAQPGFDYQTPVGTLNTKLRVVIVESDKLPRNTDYILELQLDENTGIPTQPFRIRRVWEIQDAEPMRAGQPVKHAGGIEYFRCFVEEDNLGYNNRVT